MIHTRADRITNIEGDPDSPISRGCLCPKGASTFQLVTGDHRLQKVLYRRPYSLKWEVLPLAKAMDMVAERVKNTRDATWEETDEQGIRLRRTMGIAHLGGAVLDNEENYLIKKLFPVQSRTGFGPRLPGPIPATAGPWPAGSEQDHSRGRQQPPDCRSRMNPEQE
jgi:anaerobic selenocysteine-containing dehydrogenase